MEPSSLQRHRGPLWTDVFHALGVVLVTMTLLCGVPPMAVAAATPTPSPSVSESSDTTLTMTMSVSIEPPSATMTSSRSSTQSSSPATVTEEGSVTGSHSRTHTPSPDASPTVPTRTKTASEGISSTVTQSVDVSGYSKTFNVTQTESISGTTQVSDSRTSSISDIVTGSEGIETATLSMTMTLSLSMEVASQTSTPSPSPTSTPSNERSHSRSNSPTVTLYPTEAASISASVSRETRSFTSHKTLSAWSPTVSVSVVETDTATQSHTKRHTHSRSLRVSPSNSSSFTVVDTQTRSISPSPSHETRTSDVTISMFTVSPTISASLRRIDGNAAVPQLSISSSKSFSFSVIHSPSPSSERSSTMTFSGDISASRSGSSTAVSGSLEGTKTMSFEEQLTSTVTVSLSASGSRTQGTVSDWRTQSVTRSPTFGSWQHSMTVTYTVTRSRDLTVSVGTSTATLTESRNAESRTRQRTRSSSISTSLGTITEGLSESRTITWTVSQSKVSSTRSQRTSEATATMTPSDAMTVPTSTQSRSQELGSHTVSNTSSPTNDRTAFSASLSQSLSIRTVSGRFTPTPQRGRHSFTSTSSEAVTVTTTDSGTIGTATQTIRRQTSLSNAFLSAVQSVLFPSLADSSAPCISLALYVEFPLFLVFVVQLLLCLTSKSLNWRVTTDTHMHVPVWRSLSTATAYVGCFIPCHLRCAYAHTLRCMLQMLVVLLVLEAIVYGLDPQAGNTAAFCVALCVVVAQVAKPLTHAAYHYYRFPHDAELSAQMQLAQMKRIVRLRKKEMLAAKKLERERRRREGLDDVSESTDEEPEFAYDTEKVVAFDYLDDEVGSIGTRRFGELDVDFPSEHDVFGDQEYPELMDEQRTEQVSGPGYVDVTFPGEENMRIIDLFSERRVSGVEEALTSGGGSRKSVHSSSFVRDVPAVSGKQLRKQSRRGSKTSLDKISLGGLASFSSPTRAALAVAEGRVTPSSSASHKRRPKKKRIGPGPDGVVVIPDFDDDFGVKELPDSDEDDDAATAKARRRYQSEVDKAATAKKAAGASPAVVHMFSDMDPSELMDEEDEEEDDRQSRASSTGSRFRTELFPIVTRHTSATIVLVLVLGALLFAVDRFDELCASGFDGSFGALWGIAVLVDATLGDAMVVAVVYAHRQLTASGEEGNRVASFLHPFEGELRTRMYEHLSQRFGV